MAASRKTAYHHGDLRTALLAAASDLIARSGPDGFTLRELAREVGVSHPAVYRHFDTKQHLLAAIALAGLADLTRTVASAVRGRTLTARIKSMARAWFSWANRNPGTYGVIFGPRLNEDGMFPELEEAIGKGLSALAGPFLDAGIAPAQAKKHAVGLMTMLHGYCDLVQLRRIRAKTPADAEKYLAEVIIPFAEGAALTLKQD